MRSEQNKEFMMNKILLILAITFFFTACDDFHKCKLDEDSSTLKCSEETYNVVNIEGKAWLAENTHFYTDFSYCYGDDFEKCLKYGRLYTWQASKKVCPIGWRIPTKAEYETLIANGDFKKLNIINAGYRYHEDNYVDLEKSARVWADDEYDAVRGIILNIEDGKITVEHFNKDIAASVRCIKD